MQFLRVATPSLAAFRAAPRLSLGNTLQSILPRGALLAAPRPLVVRPAIREFSASPVTFALGYDKKGGRLRKFHRSCAFRRGTTINQVLANSGAWVLRAVEGGQLTETQIESCKRVMKKQLRRSTARLFIRVKAFVPMTKKPLEVRMGKGKGSKIYKWVYPLRAGKVVFEMANCSQELAKRVLMPMAKLLPVRCKFGQLKDV